MSILFSEHMKRKMYVMFYTHLKISYRNVVHDYLPRQILTNQLDEINYVRLQDINQAGHVDCLLSLKEQTGSGDSHLSIWLPGTTCCFVT